MRGRSVLLALGGPLAVAALVAGCRPEEQGRVTEYKPGVYLGQKDSQLNEGQRKALTERTRLQAGLDPGGGSASKADVRPPAK
jgi:hypothetical protein